MTSQVRNLWCRSQNKMGPSSKYVSSQHIVDLRQPQVAMKHHLRSAKNTCVAQSLYSEFRPLVIDHGSSQCRILNGEAGAGDVSHAVSVELFYKCVEFIEIVHTIGHGKYCFSPGFDLSPICHCEHCSLWRHGDLCSKWPHCLVQSTSYELSTSLSI